MAVSFAIVPRKRDQSFLCRASVVEPALPGWDKSNPRRGYVRSSSVTTDAMQRTLDFLKAN